MNAAKKARELRRKCGQTGKIDVDAVAALLGLRVIEWPFPSDEVQEVVVGRCIGVAPDLSEEERRWAIAHAIGHHVMHSGNEIWLRARTQLSLKFERQAEQFAYSLLVSGDEIRSEGMKSAPEIAEFFGIPR